MSCKSLNCRLGTYLTKSLISTSSLKTNISHRTVQYFNLKTPLQINLLSLSWFEPFLQHFPTQGTPSEVSHTNPPPCFLHTEVCNPPPLCLSCPSTSSRQLCSSSHSFLQHLCSSPLPWSPLAFHPPFSHQRWWGRTKKAWLAARGKLRQTPQPFHIYFGNAQHDKQETTQNNQGVGQKKCHVCQDQFTHVCSKLLCIYNPRALGLKMKAQCSQYCPLC